MRRPVSTSSEHSLCTRLTFLGSNTWAAVIGSVFWKKERSNVVIARFTGGKKQRDIFYEVFYGTETIKSRCQLGHGIGGLMKRE